MKTLLTRLFCIGLLFIVAGCASVSKLEFGPPLSPAAQAELPPLNDTGRTINDNYFVGVAKYDITGPASNIGMMGYADPFQKTEGILDRQWARAFIVAQKDGKRVVFVNVDQASLFRSVYLGVVEKLKARYGDLYTEDNLVLSATHTHSTPGGHAHGILYNGTILGFNAQTYDATVEGIFQAIVRAHEDLKPGSVHYGLGELYGASINRSIEAFKANPEAGHTSSIDPEMIVLQFRQGSEAVGMISWFASHAVSIPKYNELISADNKGFAQYSIERQSPDGFIAAFAQSNAGDMSPNLDLNPVKIPEQAYIQRTRENGLKQADMALSIMSGPLQKMTGTIDYKHQFIDFSNQQVGDQFTGAGNQKTCEAALGKPFMAGTEDGRGPFSKEGKVKTKRPRNEESHSFCHFPKPIPWFIDIGETSLLSSPEILPISIVKIGQMGLLAVPAEFTITSGRRLKDTVSQVPDTGLEHLVIAGYANSFSGYVATKEEYDLQHYEGASTHFGPWTLAAYQQAFDILAKSLAAKNDPQFSGDEPRPKFEPEKTRFNLQRQVLLDRHPINKSYGTVKEQARYFYHTGEEVSVVFWSANPRSNLMTMGTFLEVQKQIGDDWVTIATDNDWSTRIAWDRHLIFKTKARISWHIPEDVETGIYRILHRGTAKGLFKRKDFVGVSETFEVRSRGS